MVVTTVVLAHLTRRDSAVKRATPFSEARRPIKIGSAAHRLAPVNDVW